MAGTSSGLRREGVKTLGVVKQVGKRSGIRWADLGHEVQKG